MFEFLEVKIEKKMLVRVYGSYWELYRKRLALHRKLDYKLIA